MGSATSYTSAQIDSMYGTQAGQITSLQNAGIQSAGIDANGHMTITRNDASIIDAGQVGAPTGSVVMYTSPSPPPGWLLCDGAAVSRTTYAALWTLLGTRFGAGNGSTTFNVPSMQARFPRMDTAALAASGGGAAHNHTMVDHDHDLDGGNPIAVAQVDFQTGPGNNIRAHRADLAAGTTYAGTFVSDLTNAALTGTTPSRGTRLMGHTVTANVVTDAAGATAVPPYLNLNFIIKT